MSKKKSTSNGADQAPDLSALNFGPAWARDEPKKPRYKDHGGGKPRAQSSDKFSKDRPPRRDQPRRDFQRRDRPQRTFTPRVEAPAGVTARIMPIEEGMDAMAKQISDTGRTHSVFELAWVVMGGLDRFHVVFESEKETFYRSKSDHSVWLSQSECIAHFWSAELWKNHYDEKAIEVEAPSGNFPSVARCGVSQKLIGPPNYHAYQQTIIKLHSEQAANMPIDLYKSKIVMENSEEAIAEWKESMTKSSQWSPKPKQTEGEEATSEEPIILATRRDVEEHFKTNGFAEEFENGNMMSALGNIHVKKISPGLFTLLKTTVAEEKRYPGKLASILCKQMSGRHLAVYKWKKKLHCGPARPKRIAEDVVMADRPTMLYKWVSEHPSGNLDEMWKACLPADIDDETKKQWYHDLHWLINEGQVLLFSDGKLHTAKEKAPEVKAQKPKPAKKEVKEEVKEPSKEE